jgi:predicted phage-related endonuclease
MNGIVKVHHVQHGSPEWQELRSMNTWNASEAPIIMGDHPKQSRNELMHAKATMTPKEFERYVQDVVFERGHDTEDRARKILSDRIHDELFRVTVTHQIDDFVLLASLDGAVIPDLTIGFEHKQWSMELVAYLEEHNEPPPFIYWQLEHQLATVPSMEKILFVVSDGTEKNMVVFEYRAVPGRRARLIAGWKQWREDLKNYVPVFKEAKKVGIKPADLPVPTLEVSGELATQGNIDEFNTLFRQMVESINTDLKTDQDFADADAAVKYLKDLRGRLELSKKMALGKAVPLEEAFKIIDDLDALAQVTAKNLAEQIKARKDNRKQEIANDAIRQVKDANDAAVTEFNPYSITWSKVCPIVFDPYAHMKNLKSFDSMAAKVNAAMTKVKLDIGEARDKVRGNLKLLQESWKGLEFLFRDINDLVVLEPNILKMMIKQRIDEHNAQLREQETERVNKHRQVLIKLDAVIENSDGQDVTLLRISRKSIAGIDTSMLEEFADEGAKKKTAALAHLDATITRLEAEEAQRQKESDEQRQAEMQRQLEANRQTQELSRAAVLRAQEESKPPIDIAACDVGNGLQRLCDALESGQINENSEDFQKGLQAGRARAGLNSIAHALHDRDATPLTTDLDEEEAEFEAMELELAAAEMVIDEDDLNAAADAGIHAAEVEEPADDIATPPTEDVIKHLMIYYAEDRETIVRWIKHMAREL